jgi:hypothetical protein
MSTDLTFLSTDEIREQAPVIFAGGPTREVSERYVYADTPTIINDMDKLGWKVRQVGQRKARKEATSFSPHFVRFANPDYRIKGNGGDYSFPEVVMKNRYDGLGAVEFMAGIFRLVCSNGMVISTESFGEMKLNHRGYSFEEMRKLVGDRVVSIEEQVAVMNAMKDTALMKEQQRELAMQGLLIRGQVSKSEEGKFRGKVDLLTLDEILTPERNEDKGTDLWNTFNVVQEKMVNGGFHTQLGLNTKIRKVRAIKSFEQDLSLNKQLFSAAQELIAA